MLTSCAHRRGQIVASLSLCHRATCVGSREGAASPTLIRISLFIEFVRFVNPIGMQDETEKQLRVSLCQSEREAATPSGRHCCQQFPRATFVGFCFCFLLFRTTTHNR